MTRRPSTPTAQPSAAPAGTQASKSGPDDFDRMVSEVHKAAVADQQRFSQTVEIARVPWYGRVTTAVLLATLAVAIWGVEAVFWRVSEPQLGARDRDAALRFAMAQQVARIEDFRAANRLLPRSLADVTEAIKGMSYAALDSMTYRVTGTDGGLVLSFRSDSSLKTFLGASLALIREHRK